MPIPHPRHSLGLAALLLPGSAAIAVAVLADAIRGGDVVADWGTGQSVLSLAGVLLLGGGWLLHRKAVRDEQSERRRYSRTVAFVFMPVVILVLLPLAVAEVVARLLPTSDAALGDYRQADDVLGFTLAPSTHYRAISHPKDFSIRIRINEHGFREGPGSPPNPSQADVAIIGDSHAFGFGVPEDQTLAAWLHQDLASAGYVAGVLNTGVPGYGLGQMLLRMQTLPSLPAGAVVVVYINPVNDLVNLSSAVDYHCPKPYAVLREGELRFHPPPQNWCGGPYLFSPPFAKLNEAFDLKDDCRWYHSALLRRIRLRLSRPSTDDDGAVLLVDQSSEREFLDLDRRTIQAHPLREASRFWPEMPRFEDQRTRLSQLTGAVFQAMQAHANQQRWHLIVVVADEALANQPYWQNRLNQIREANPEMAIEMGWSRETVLDQLNELEVETIPIDHSSEDPAAMYVENDEHTSGEAFRRIARQVSERLLARGWVRESPRQ